MATTWWRAMACCTGRRSGASWRWWKPRTWMGSSRRGRKRLPWWNANCRAENAVFRKGAIPLPQQRIVCFLDFDNTLFDNDGLKADLNQQLSKVLTPAQVQRFWELYEQERHEEGTVDYPATMERFRSEISPALADRVWSLIWDYPFATRLFPGSLAVLAHLTALRARPSVVSDGDPLYQPHKIALSGVAAAVQDRVKVYIHKQDHLQEILAWQPADHYIMVDDKA